MKRRSFARALCLSIATVSGCTAFKQPDTVRIGLIEVVNLDESSGHNVHVQVTDSGDTIYSSRHQLPKQTDTVPPSIVVDNELPDTQGQYELEVTTDSKSEPEKMNVPSMTEDDCTNVIILVRSESWVGLTATERCYGVMSND
jgi:Tfp pilus assembly protein PilW